MRTNTHLKPVRTNEENAVRVTREETPETRGTWLETTRLPSLIDDMERMMNEMFHRPMMGMGMTPFRNLLHEVGRMGGMTPNVDMYEDKGAIVVKADLPGMTKADIAVKLVDNMLEITGERKTEERIDRRDFLKLERTYGTFSRTLRLPEGIDGEHVTAKFEDGVLEIRIPKPEDKRTIKTIPVK